MYVQLLLVLIISFFGTAILNIVFRFLGKRGRMGNLFQDVRGGTPRAIGIVPFLLISLFLPSGFNDLVLVIGICALIDDIVGRRKIGNIPIEIGQLARGIGMLCVIGFGYPIMGLSSILVALFIQPINISDMQPGTTCNVVIMMSLLTIILMLLLGTGPIEEIPAYYTPLIVLLACIGYAPLDYLGKIMMGEVGNHAFGVALGICFFMLGGFIGTLILCIVSSFLIAYFRRFNLSKFLVSKLRISNPTYGDLMMDVLTGGGLGDFLRKIILGDKQYEVKNPILIVLGFRRLLYNPFAPNNSQHFSNSVKQNNSLSKYS
ncbi:MAG: cell wall biosynthesis protein [archaeon]|nr:cell wall biosynthesis protein [archaeon]